MVRKALFILGSLGFSVSSTFISLAVAEPNFAQVQSVHGKVLINQGKGFVAAFGGVTLKPGDKILVSQQASAVVAYGNGCEVSVSEAKVLTIAKTAPCPAGAKIASVGSSFATPVAGGSGGGLPPAAIGLGAFGAVAATALIVNLTNKPASAQ